MMANTLPKNKRQIPTSYNPNPRLFFYPRISA